MDDKNSMAYGAYAEVRLSKITSGRDSSRLVDFLKEPHTAVDCFPALYNRKISENEYGLALVEAVAHLNHLYKEKIVSREMNSDGAYVYRTKSDQNNLMV